MKIIGFFQGCFYDHRVFFLPGFCVTSGGRSEHDKFLTFEKLPYENIDFQNTWSKNNIVSDFLCLQYAREWHLPFQYSPSHSFKLLLYSDSSLNLRENNNYTVFYWILLLVLPLTFRDLSSLLLLFIFILFIYYVFIFAALVIFTFVCLSRITYFAFSVSFPCSSYNSFIYVTKNFLSYHFLLSNGDYSIVLRLSIYLCCLCICLNLTVCLSVCLSI